MLISLPEFTTAVQALLASKEQALNASAAAAGEHLCFIGSGREEEDQYVHMVVAYFLQRHLAFVSVVAGGYAGTSPYIFHSNWLMRIIFVKRRLSLALNCGFLIVCMLLVARHLWEL